MIALISDQRMQNVIPILQDGAAYGELVLVLSKERSTGMPHHKYRKATDDLIAVLGSRLKVNPSDKFVDPYNIEDVARAVSSLIPQNTGADNIVVNISGGTKPMAIGALRAAHKAGVACLYTNTEDGEILWLFPDGLTKSDPIQVQGLDVPLYIRAYGEEVISSRKVEELNEIQKASAQVIGEQHTVIYQKVIVPVTSAIKGARKNGSGFPITCKVTPTRRQRQNIEQLARNGLWEWHQDTEEIVVTQKSNADFLNGGWVEVYVAMQLQQTNLFDDVRLNIELKGVEGEIDVAAVSNGKLVLFECKSNVQQSQQLSKLDSFRRRLGGPYAQAYYARASAAYASRIREQCRKFRLNGVFFGPELRSIGEQIGQRLREVSP